MIGGDQMPPQGQECLTVMALCKYLGGHQKENCFCSPKTGKFYLKKQTQQKQTKKNLLVFLVPGVEIKSWNLV